MAGAGDALGDVLYADTKGHIPAEAEWVGLVDAIARGDALALADLHARVHRAVFTLLVRLTSSRSLAEDLTLEVLEEVRRTAASYRESDATVVAWIMNTAREIAIARLRREQKANPADPASDGALVPIDMPDYRHIMSFKEESRALQSALVGLRREERQAIEAVYFGQATCAEAAAALRRPTDVVKANLCDGLQKLGSALARGWALAEASGPACEHACLSCAYALDALPEDELQHAGTHLAQCVPCRRKVEALAGVIATFVAWPTDLLRCGRSLHERVAKRIAEQAGELVPRRRLAARLPGSGWQAVAPGISCLFLANDPQRHRVSMLVRLVPGGEYPPHTHAGTEELHLLDGELWIDERKLYPGDYNRAEAGTGDKRVWSQTGCMCVLVTSTRDLLG